MGLYLSLTLKRASIHELTHQFGGYIRIQTTELTWIPHSFSLLSPRVCAYKSSKCSEWLWIFSCLLPVNSCYEYANDNEIEDPSAYCLYGSMYFRTSTLACVYRNCMYAYIYICRCWCRETENTLELNSELSSIHQLSPLSINGWAVGEKAVANDLNYGFSFPIEISAQLFDCCQSEEENGNKNQITRTHIHIFQYENTYSC